MKTIRVVVLLLLGLAAAPAASAQVTETSVAFDSAGKVRTLTPALVTRFELRAPTWPVAGEFLEAKLYSVSSGGHVLAVERMDRRVERYQLTADNVAALRFAIDATMTKSGAAVTDERSDISASPASGAFVRNQMLLTWIVYGPSLAALSGDETAGTALYLLATGASYFITTGISRNQVITRAQNHLATDGALRGWLTAAGITYAFAGETDDRNFAATALVGSLGGAIMGFQRAKGFTDSEAQASASLSTFAALTTFGLAGTVGLIDDDGGDDNGRGVTAAVVAAGLTGYFLGPEYPRRAKYTVTKGDIQVTRVGAALGTAIALIPFVDTDVDVKVGFAAATGGLLAGTAIAERAWARKYDHSNWHAGQTSLGLLAGGLMGAAGAVLTEPSPQVGYGLVVAGAAFGAILGHNLATPVPATTREAFRAPSSPQRFGRVSVDPTALAFAAGRVPGRHSLIRVSF